MIIEEEDYLAHYGILRRSGRYPWGSGGNEDLAEKNSKGFLDYTNLLRQQGLSEKETADAMAISINQLRALRSIARTEQRQADITQAQRLKDASMSNVAIGKEMGYNESTVRNLLAPGAKDKADILENTSNLLREQVKEKTMVDVGRGVERQVNVSRQKLDTAVTMLHEEGYEVYNLKVPALGTTEMTTVKTLCPPGMPFGEAVKRRGDIKQIQGFSNDAGRSYLGLVPPMSLDSNRIGINYRGEGGEKHDGLVFVREGVPDVSLGGNHYAQVRIMVDGTHYIKGMAMYRDNMPPGVDLVFNTSKDRTPNKLDALKPLENDADNPFGSQISRQIIQVDEHGHEHTTSVMNLVYDAGKWSEWNNALSSQMLSKQDPVLAKKQLDLALERSRKELEGIKELTNPTVKRKLLLEFSDEADHDAVTLHAHHLPRQGTHVILPIDSMKPTEIHAPNFIDGERVVLIRHPHGGIFEIPELTVNNRNPDALRLIGPKARDAVGIHHSVAEILSGADFDGDTVLVIPNNDRKIKTAPPLEELKNFDAKKLYKGYEGMPKMGDASKRREMGDISNLITDMTLHQATHAEIAAAVKHSMVVIDAQKHDLNWRQSKKDNGIAKLKQKYQRDISEDGSGGAATLISRARSEIRVPHRKERPAREGGFIDRETGELRYVPTGKTYVDATGQTIPMRIKTVRLAETGNAFTLSSGTPMEAIYAEHSNALKSLANKARLEYLDTPLLKSSPSAKKAYASEVASLKASLNLAVANSPHERQAQIAGNVIFKAKMEQNPDLSKKRQKRVKAQALAEARHRVGAKKPLVKISHEEWNAIQAGAISDNMLSQILSNADPKQVRELATPHQHKLMSGGKIARAQLMLKNGVTRAEVARALGVSLTTLDRATKGEGG